MSIVNKYIPLFTGQYNINMIVNNKEIEFKIRSWVEKYPRSYFKKIKAKDNLHILKYIEENTPLLNDKYFILSTKVYWIIHDLTEFPKCKICGKEIRKNIKINDSYPTHCCAKCLSKDVDVQKHKEESYEKRYGEGITNPFQAKEVIRKIDETNLKKYKVKRYTQSEEYRTKIKDKHDLIEESKNNTHRENNSFNESKMEIIVYDILSKKYKNIKTQFYSERYPFNCDFYVEDIDTFIEFNGTWTHGSHPFDPLNDDDMKMVSDWKSKKSKYYDNAVYTWTDLDVRKRNVAKQNRLNHIELWSISDVYRFVFGDKTILDSTVLIYHFNRKKLLREYDYYKNISCDSLCPYKSSKNEIVKYFQQDSFYSKEKELWNNLEIKNKIIDNRCKYLNKSIDELTHEDILTGFKKSGIYYGYSHFNPLWFKWFIQQNNVRKCYDPCGGWGHRLLGGISLEKYIYNDLSYSTFQNVNRIIDYFKIKNTITYNMDARNFEPKEEFDAIFTCPPYYNIEKYECGVFNSKSDYNDFIDSIFELFNKKINCKIFGLVIREDLLTEKHQNYSDKIELNINTEQYLSETIKTNKEYLFIYRK